MPALFLVKDDKIPISSDSNLIGCRLGQDLTFCEDCITQKQGKKCTFLKHCLKKNIPFKRLKIKARKRKEVDAYTKSFQMR